MIKALNKYGLLLVLLLTGTQLVQAQLFSETDKQIIYGGDTAGMLRVIQITQPNEHKILLTPSVNIQHNAPGLDLLAKRMLLSMRDTARPGVGIAAPQLGINKKIIWVQRFDKAGEPFELYLNPQITWQSVLYRKGREGCLSIPDISGNVLRHYTIGLTYQQRDGTYKNEIIEGFTAVIFQHEIDHLNGILFTQRLQEQDAKKYYPLATGVDLYLEQPSKR